MKKTERTKTSNVSSSSYPAEGRAPDGCGLLAPMEIKVGYNIYTVEEDSLQNDENRCGVTFKQQSRIKISPHLSDHVYRETLLHEVLHAVCCHAGISDNEQLDEETWISRVSPTLLTVLQENHEFLRTLLA